MYNASKSVTRGFCEQGSQGLERVLSDRQQVKFACSWEISIARRTTFAAFMPSYTFQSENMMLVRNSGLGKREAQSKMWRRRSLYRVVQKKRYPSFNFAITSVNVHRF